MSMLHNTSNTPHFFSGFSIASSPSTQAEREIRPMKSSLKKALVKLRRDSRDLCALTAVAWEAAVRVDHSAGQVQVLREKVSLTLVLLCRRWTKCYAGDGNSFEEVGCQASESARE
eukprot:s16_g30.t1